MSGGDTEPDSEPPPTFDEPTKPGPGSAPRARLIRRPAGSRRLHRRRGVRAPRRAEHRRLDEGRLASKTRRQVREPARRRDRLLVPAEHAPQERLRRAAEEAVL